MSSFGDKKVKDMIESLLPSTGRKKARWDRENAHRKERRKSKRWPLDTPVNDRERRIAVNDAKWERRGKDKLSFIRWAEEVTKHLPDPEDRYNFIKNLVPDNTIGRHALTHLPYEWQPEYRNISQGTLPTRAEQTAYRRSRQQSERDRLANRLHKLLGTKRGHKELNSMLKAMKPRHSEYRRVWEDGKYKQEFVRSFACPNCKTRTLAGEHDILAFVEWVLTDGNGPTKRSRYWYTGKHHGFKDAVIAFLDKREVS
ncbi:MAG TPA: hypothetical protein VJ742_12930 [Nitrososphaera sp.]|nr:hypothetical protein [Nitrososphaera sp.]